MHSLYGLFEMNRKLGIDACTTPARATQFDTARKKPLIVFLKMGISKFHSVAYAFFAHSIEMVFFSFVSKISENISIHLAVQMIPVAMNNFDSFHEERPIFESIGCIRNANTEYFIASNILVEANPIRRKKRANAAKKPI